MEGARPADKLFSQSGPVPEHYPDITQTLPVHYPVEKTALPKHFHEEKQESITYSFLMCKCPGNVVFSTG